MRGWKAAWSAAAAAAVLGCGSDYGGGGSSDYGAPAPAQCTPAYATAVTGAIGISGMAFVPACAKVAAGTAVTFTNGDATAHTVTTDAGQAESFDSGSLAPGAQFTHTFTTAGTVHIHCSIHPEIRLTLFVQ